MQLFVDGSNERMAVAYQRMPDKLRDNTIWAKTPEEAISILKNYREQLEIVSFEHDLTEFVHGDSRREDSGMEIVRWLEKQNPKQFDNIQFIIHGWGDSDKKMALRLKEANFNKIKLQPFGG